MFNDSVGLYEYQGGIAVDCDEDSLNQYGIVHGGLLSTLLDESMGYLILKKGTKVVTAQISVQYILPGKRGRITSKANMVREGKDLIFMEATAEQDGVTLAMATGIYFKI
ncbi:MAG: PaaI family thioesterase [Nitrososphaerota archaeon]|nr:PaaI family thioesterase [Nitrososphaerota archaeon]MDG7040527.1 PaaI family thioesterase [Nitrososphaerota archaeon]MDG7046239.1 PaaI family thioesterase [Nitrososphaerota archaeon]